MDKSIKEIIDFNIRTRRIVGGLGKLKKNGKVVSLNGQVYSRKTTKAGNEVIIIDNWLGKTRKGGSKRWQMVLIKNIVKLSENNWEHKKIK